MLRIKSALMFFIAITNVPLSSVVVYFLAWRVRSNGDKAIADAIINKYWKMNVISFKTLVKEVVSGVDQNSWYIDQNSQLPNPLDA